MKSKEQILADSHSAEAITAAALAAETIEKARKAQIEATLKATENTRHDELVAALKEAMTDDSPNAYILVRRIPVICNDITWIKRGIFGLYTLIGMGIVGAIIRAVLNV